MSVWTVIPQDHILIGTKTFSTTRRFLIFFSNYWPDISFSSGRRQAYISLSFHRRLALVGWATLPSPSTTYQEIWCKFSISIIYPSLVSMQRMFDTLTGTCWNTSSITCDPTKRWKLFRRRTKPWTGEEWMTQWMLQHPRDFHQILRRTQIQKTRNNTLSIVKQLDCNDLKQSFDCDLFVSLRMRDDCRRLFRFSECLRQVRGLHQKSVLQNVGPCQSTAKSSCLCFKGCLWQILLDSWAHLERGRLLAWLSLGTRSWRVR